MEPIVRLAARGDGVSESGRFVPGAVPGDTVDPNDVIAPGAHRAEPPCRHFGTCGGCQLQHVDEAMRADFVSGRILAALSSNGIAPTLVHSVHLSPPYSRRRVSLRAQKGQDGKVAIGFNEAASRRIVDLTECHVMRPALFACAGSLRGPLTEILPAGAMCGITLTETATGIDALFSDLAPRPETLTQLAAWAGQNAVASVTVEDRTGAETAVQIAMPLIEFGGLPVALPPGAFLQATEDGEAALVAAVTATLSGAAHVADLFCGLGTFAAPLSATRRVHAVDAAGASVANLSAAARKAGLPIETEHRDLFRRPLSPAELDRFDGIVLDPPRAGAKAQVEALAKSGTTRIAYVSCNPGTFARDTKILTAAEFQLAELWPVGQFRWSTHVELVAAFERAA